MSAPDDSLWLPTRRTILKGGVAAGASMLLAACGGSPSHAGSGTGSASAAANGTLAIGQPGDVVVKKSISDLAVNHGFNYSIFDRLTRYDHATLKPQPMLAKSWKESADGKTVTIQLRDDVKYHSGRPFTPDDVIFSIKQVQDPANSAQLRSTALVITGMEATGPAEVTLTLAHKISNLFDLFEFMAIVDKDTIDQLHSGTKLVGTGPFVWDSYQANNHLAMVRNPNYWGPAPNLSKATLRIIAQAQALLSSLQAGQSQLALNLTAGQLVGLNKSTTTVVDYDTYATMYYVGANVKVPPFDRKEVRQALAYAFDRDRILKDVYGGIGFSTAAPWPKTSAAYNKDVASHYTYDPDKAKSLLKAAGVTNLSIKLAVNSARSSDASAAQIVQFNLQQVGINAEAVTYDVAQFVSKLTSGQLPGLWYNIGGFNQLTPATMVVSAFPYNAAKNASNFSSPEYTELSGQAWTADPNADLSEVYAKLNNLLLDEAFVMPLLLTTTVAPMSNKVQNFAYNMFDSIDLRRISV